MEVIIKENPKAAGKVAAAIVGNQVGSKPDSVLGLATGSTPLVLYRELIALNKQGRIDFSRVSTFNLDEYLGLGANHPSSYNYYMHHNLFKHINIKKHRIHIPDGLAPDIPEHCRQYEGAIRAAGGIDLQVLGIGSDGHIGFNEPSSSLASRTRIKTLTAETIKDNTRFFPAGESIPHHVITMGVGTILESRICLLMAFGANKAAAVREMVEGPISSMVPASALQLHAHAIVVLDEAAAAELKHHEYYRWVYANKPDWQKYE